MKVMKSACAVALTLGIMAAAAAEKERVLIFGAHPDENIACAGTMLLMKDRFEVHVGVMTHGERGLGLAGFRDGSTRARRIKEEEAADSLAGAKTHWFDEVDGDCYANREVCRKVADLLKELKPRAVIAMWPLDRHLDHVMSSACIQKAIGIAGMQDRIELYFMEEAYDSRTFVPAYYVDVTEVADQKREFIRKHACQNANDSMCRLEMEDGASRAQRCASWAYGGRQVERFAVFGGKPQGSRCIFNELPPPKGWSQDWSTAKPSPYTPEGGMKWCAKESLAELVE